MIPVVVVLAIVALGVIGWTRDIVRAARRVPTAVDVFDLSTWARREFGTRNARYRRSRLVKNGKRTRTGRSTR